ncbi:uncharacterized protein LOC120412662 [Culex pipiens pallens]|uniref:uncharacterized protein LOC120412661 n=1 Tax=Culex pipiens pallens TaxID=42434 RepID=UPI001952C27C|nr:uncharacterized protein LOC120412661 [Culex pipiens pallens]XP_039429159.1 uncharacterized protein LOC120412662 [Culex pipiens pallens]
MSPWNPTTPMCPRPWCSITGNVPANRQQRPKSQSVTILGGAQDVRTGPPEAARINRYRVPGSGTVIRVSVRRSRNRHPEEIAGRRKAGRSSSCWGPKKQKKRSDRIRKWDSFEVRRRRKVSRRKVGE